MVALVPFPHQLLSEWSRSHIVVNDFDCEAIRRKIYHFYEARKCDTLETPCKDPVYSHQMANHLGLNTHQMQIMKASFFGSNMLHQHAHSKPLPEPYPRSLMWLAGLRTQGRMAHEPPAQSHNLSFTSASYQRPSLNESFRRDRQRSTISMSPQPSQRPQLLPVQALTRPTLVITMRDLNKLVPMSQSISNTKTGFVADVVA